MTTGSWDPNATQAQTSLIPDTDLLQRYLALSREDKLNDLGNQLDATEQQTHAPLMQLDKTQWLEAGAALNDGDIEHLMRFFTKAEQLPGWEAGAKSPVIWLGKILKQRGHGISKELAQWIKANSDNRFLPHGAL